MSKRAGCCKSLCDPTLCDPRARPRAQAAKRPQRSAASPGSQATPEVGRAQRSAEQSLPLDHILDRVDREGDGDHEADEGHERHIARLRLDVGGAEDAGAGEQDAGENRQDHVEN